MRRWWLLNRILWKQYLIHNRIWILLLLLLGILAVCLGAKDNSKDYSGIQVGVCVEDANGRRLMESMEEDDGIFHFVSCVDREQMIREIERGDLECGFVLPEGFYENIIKGRRMRQIPLYYSPSSTVHKISYEVVFSHLFEMLSDDVLRSYIDYAEQNGVFPKKEKADLQERLLDLKGKYSENGSTFAFDMKQIGIKGEKKESSFSTIRGCIAVLIFFLSLLGLESCMEVRELSKGLNKRKRIEVRECSLTISVLAGVFFGGALIVLWGQGESFFREIGGLIIYFIVLQVYLRILMLFLGKPAAVYGVLPVLIPGSLLFCPVFVQIENYLPVAGFLEKLFPVSYYLNLF